MKPALPMRWFRLSLICLLLAGNSVLVGPALLGSGPAGVIVAFGSPAFGQTSGGYSRPGGGSSIGSYGGSVRRPAISGGYGGQTASRPSGFGLDYSRGGDRAISRQSSSQALRDYRASQARPVLAPMPESRRPSTGWADESWGAWASPRRYPSGGWGGGGYAPGYGGSSGGGVWDAVLAWSLLNSLSRPQSVTYFQDNRGDPRYAQWRAEADQRAQSDPAVAKKLAELDTLMTQSKAKPASESIRPSDTGGTGVSVIVIFVGGAILVGLWMLRRRAGVIGGGGPMGMARGVSGSLSPSGLSGSAATRFRVGMTFPFDPSPFMLAAGITKVKPPAADGMISVEALGLITDGGVLLHRLYLPGDELFFMLHLGPDGTPDECRYFSMLDQVTPANPNEWGLWLDPAQGMIGWPQFQTKDGKLYDRVWAPGNSRIPPRQQVETLRNLSGTAERKLQTMLYAAHTGAASPAPNTEYVLVCAVEQGSEAWVEVYSGIDINPASLTLPAVPLSK
jgi:Protein of unknown function (DUF2491)